MNKKFEKELYEFISRNLEAIRDDIDSRRMCFVTEKGEEFFKLFTENKDILVAGIISVKPTLYPIIDKMYSKLPDDRQELEFELINSPYVATYSTEQQIMALKVLAIINYCKSNNNYRLIVRLAKYYDPDVERFYMAKKNKRIVGPLDFFEMKKTNVFDFHGFSCFLLVMYLINTENKNMIYDLDQFDEAFLGKCKQILDFTKEMKTLQDNLRERTCKFTKKEGKFFFDTLKEFLNVPTSNSNLNELTYIGILKQILCNEVEELDCDEAKVANLVCLNLSTILKVNGINDEILLSRFDITPERLNTLICIINTFSFIFNVHEVPESALIEMKFYLIIFLYVDCFSKQINLLEKSLQENLMYKTSLQDNLTDIEEQEIFYKNELDVLKGSYDRLLSEKEKLFKTNLELNRTCYLLNKENERLKEQLEELKNLEQFKSSREQEEDEEDYIIYSEEEEQEEEDIEDIMNILNNFNCIVFGGHRNWVNKLKELFPNFVFLEGTDVNKGLPNIEKVDFIFINANFFNHAFFRKIQNYTKKETKVFYLSGYGNMNRTILEMWQSVKHVF